MTYTYTDEEHTSIKAVAEDGSTMFIPACPGNRHYDELMRSGARIQPYVAPVTSRSEEEISKEIRQAYQNESDPLFFKWQAGEGTEQAWRAKRVEIAARYM